MQIVVLVATIMSEERTSIFLYNRLLSKYSIKIILLTQFLKCFLGNRSEVVLLIMRKNPATMSKNKNLGLYLRK